ncbi:MAG: patatin-like phospholipase family protein [Cyclobacteriaceae bacterium]|nr:patatin-like phospholipase family protein [Cyclobacteriaceae bacterium]
MRLLCLFLLVSSLASAQQKVAVVLSGGAAKGLAHIGVLKALEENEIPIDYVVGTSMGGIVAGCYAGGMSPAQIEDIVLSREFLDWVNGRFENGRSYYYFKKENDASFLKLNLSLDSTFSFQLNTSIASDLSLNFALAEKLAQPSAIANNNFDSLFVPLRVMASDIFTQTEVVLKKGVLSDALRTTQTAPFFYNPIRIDGKYLFDGGVYNNFPVEVAQRDFSPNVIIGSNVSSKVYNSYPYGEDEKLISRSLLYMLLDKSNPNDVPPNGIYIQSNLQDYTAFDFTKAKAMIDSGYFQTLRQMPEIKSKIAERRTCESVSEARNKFNNKTPPIIVEDIRYEGFSKSQQKYFNRFFKSGKRPLYYNEVKTGYYKLVSEPFFNNLYPSFNYDQSRKRFDFKLTKRPQNNFQVDFGGVIATRNISNIFLGLNYYSFNRVLTHFTANFFAGNFYKSLLIKARMDLPYLGQLYVEPELVINSWSFLQGDDVIQQKFTPTVLNRVDRRYGVNVGFPFGNQFKVVVNGSLLNNNDSYIDRAVLVSTDTLDLLRVRGSRLGFSISANSLNRKQYPSEGKAFSLTGNWFSLEETLTPGNTSVQNGVSTDQRNWIQGRLTLEQYFKAGIYSSGYYLEGVLSTQPTFANYFGTIIYAPAFNPLQDSRTLLLQNFRAFNYAAGGWRNVFSLRKSLDLRLEAYAFKPLEALFETNDQKTGLNNDITKIYFAGTAGLVMHSTLGPISLSLNYYDDKNRQLGVLLHVGFLLFNKGAMD